MATNNEVKAIEEKRLRIKQLGEEYKRKHDEWWQLSQELVDPKRIHTRGTIKRLSALGREKTNALRAYRQAQREFFELLDEMRRRS